jgi:hypothetical protein
VIALGIVMTNAWASRAYRRLCLQMALSVPLAGICIFIIAQFLTHPFHAPDSAIGFPAGWQCSNIRPGAPICIKGN